MDLKELKRGVEQMKCTSELALELKKQINLLNQQEYMNLNPDIDLISKNQLKKQTLNHTKNLIAIKLAKFRNDETNLKFYKKKSISNDYTKVQELINTIKTNKKHINQIKRFIEVKNQEISNNEKLENIVSHYSSPVHEKIDDLFKLNEEYVKTIKRIGNQYIGMLK